MLCRISKIQQSIDLNTLKTSQNNLRIKKATSQGEKSDESKINLKKGKTNIEQDKKGKPPIP